MNKNLIYVACIAFFAICLLWINFKDEAVGITATSSLDVIEKELKDADATTLVIFDCDDVLIHQTDVVFAPENEEMLTKCVNDFIEKKPSVAKKMKKLKGIISESINSIIIDKRMPEVVKGLQEKGIKVLMITSMKNEKLNGKYAIEIRQHELENFGFDFSKSWPDLKKKWFGEVQKSQYYESGIVCAKPGSKGEALKNFLDYSKFNPKKIVFIDDKLDNLEDIQKVAKMLNSIFRGFEYTASKKIPYDYRFSSERLTFQLKYLEETERWLSDKEAEAKMNEK